MCSEARVALRSFCESASISNFSTHVDSCLGASFWCARFVRVRWYVEVAGAYVFVKENDSDDIKCIVMFVCN